MTYLQTVFISNLKYIRKKNKISQRKLAELMGSAQTYVSLIECGIRFPSLVNIERIANALNVNSCVLFNPDLQNEEKNKIKERNDMLKKELISVKTDMLNQFTEAIDQIIKNYSDNLNIQ